MSGGAIVTDRPVRLLDVLHHAGNGLTPARACAERLARITTDPVVAGLAARVVTAIDDTMARLRALPNTERTQ